MAEGTVTTYKIDIGGGRIVELRALSFEEFTKCNQLAKNDIFEMPQHGLRHSIVGDNGQPLKYGDLLGRHLDERFTTKQMLLLRAAWEKIHAPDEDDVAALKGMTVVST